MSAARRRVVVGIGNPDRGDDGAGRAVAERLRGLLPDTVAVVEESGEAASLLAAIEGAAMAILVDAAVSGRPAGIVRRFDAAAAPLPRAAFGLASTHGFGLGEAVELARVLGQLPPECVVYAIEGGAFAEGTPLSPAVAAAVAEVAAAIAAELAGEAAGRAA
jgi:hydrogenase maturation protease